MRVNMHSTREKKKARTGGARAPRRNTHTYVGDQPGVGNVCLGARRMSFANESRIESVLHFFYPLRLAYFHWSAGKHGRC